MNSLSSGGAVWRALLGVFLAPIFASAATVNGTLTKDAMVKEFSPAANFGTAINVQVNGNTAGGFRKIAYVQFDVSIPPGSTGISAQLKLRSQTGVTQAIVAHAVSTITWSETAIAWTGRPALGATQSTVSTHVNGSDSVWTIGNLVAGNATYCYGLDCASGGDVTFSSREGPNPPVLVVTYTPPGVTPVVSLSSSDWNAAEASADTAAVTFTSSVAAPTGGLVVHYAISGTAESTHADHSGPDYTLAPANSTANTGTVTIPAGATTATLTLTPVQDTNYEGRETAVITLTSQAAYTIGSLRTVQLLIADNETAPVVNPDHSDNGTPTMPSDDDQGGFIVGTSGFLPNSECSGMAASYQYPGIVWYHRDGTQDDAIDPREKLYAIRSSHATNNGTLVKTINVNLPINWSGPAWENINWEDMAIDPETPGILWVGDIGDNGNSRPNLVLLKITEPDPFGAATSVTPTAYYFKYPASVGSVNAETMFVFEGIPHVILKEGTARVLRSPTKTLSTDRANPTVFEVIGTVVGAGNGHSIGSLSVDLKRFALSTRRILSVFESQSGLDPVNTTLSLADARTYIQDLLCTRPPAWVVRHNGANPDPEGVQGDSSAEGGTFVAYTYDVLFGSESSNKRVFHIPAAWYETQPGPGAEVPLSESLNNRPPTVSLTSPVVGATISKAQSPTLTLRAIAADWDGTISSVQFYQKLSSAPTRSPVGTGTLASGQYSANWTISGATTGTYTIYADATDNSGAVIPHSYNITIAP